MELDFKRCQKCNEPMSLEWRRYPNFSGEVFEFSGYACWRCKYFEIDHTKGGVLGNVV